MNNIFEKHLALMQKIKHTKFFKNLHQRKRFLSNSENAIDIQANEQF